MEELLSDLAQALQEEAIEKRRLYDRNVLDSKRFRDEMIFHNSVTRDFVNSIRLISGYSTRAGNLYANNLMISSSDDFIQSAIAISLMINNGIHNTVRRELRYLVETAVKYQIIDKELDGKDISEKTSYLKTGIPNAWIDVIERMQTPFSQPDDKEYKNGIKDFFYKQCAYVHPSKKQIDEQMDNYLNGNHIGFESAKSLEGINKLIFMAYDFILTIVFHGFGEELSGDLFIQIYDEDQKWKFHKGKFNRIYSRLFNYKAERKAGVK